MKDVLDVLKGRPNVDIICPTMDSGQVFQNWLTSVLAWTSEPNRLIVVNNGKSRFRVTGYKNVVHLDQDCNKGWMGGVNEGLKWSLDNSDAPFVLMMNDDTQILDHDYGWLTKMLYSFQLDPKVAAVGPMSNAIMGHQNSAFVGLPPNVEATRLSGMAMLLRKSVVKEIGLLDESLPGGDDLDYSIRLRKADYKLAICRRTFIIHHYGQTGKRVHGDHWDSQAHTEAINTALIKKHGFKWWFNTVNDRFETAEDHPGVVELEEKAVLDEIQEEINTGTVLDLGCGGKKVHPKAVGVEFRANGELGCGANAFHPAVGDVVADVLDLHAFRDGSVDALVVKHLLEHVLDIPKALKEWRRVLKPGGKLVVISPDYRFCEAMACDPSHVISMTPDTCKSWFDTVGGFNVTFAQHLPRSYVFKLVAEKTRVGCSCHPAEKAVGVAP